MGITVEQAKQLEFGDTIYSNQFKNSDGSPARWRVSGQVKTWKRDPERLQIPLKYGLYKHAYLVNGEVVKSLMYDQWKTLIQLDEMEMTEEAAFWIRCEKCNELIFPYNNLNKEQLEFIRVNPNKQMIMRCESCNGQNSFKAL